MNISFGWFSSGRDQEAITLLDQVQASIQSGFIRGRIDFVFCNKEKGETPESDKFFDVVNRFGLDLIYLSSKNFKAQKIADLVTREDWRRAYDGEVIKLIGSRKFDFVILAGYMLIASEVLCKQIKMLNLHPALPKGPKGTWQEVIWKLIEEKKTETGAMMHLVTEELDAGPPISYFTFPIRGGVFEELWRNFMKKNELNSLDEIRNSEGENEPLFKKIREEEFKRELPLIINTLKKLADKDIDVNNNREIIVNGKASTKALFLDI